MKKNMFMRLAMALVLLVLVTTSAVGGTYAKYVTETTNEDSARVANWGFETTNSEIAIENLFKSAYDTSVKAGPADTDLIAPGTTSSATFQFVYDQSQGAAPEVSYSFTVSTAGSSCDTTIQNNPNILWKLDTGAWGTWEDLLDSIEALSGEDDGSKDYQPGQLPAAFTASDDVHTVAWKWIFDENAADKEAGTANNDTGDTAMGNAATLAQVTLKITITATQID